MCFTRAFNKPGDLDVLIQALFYSVIDHGSTAIKDEETGVIVYRFSCISLFYKAEKVYVSKDQVW